MKSAPFLLGALLALPHAAAQESVNPPRHAPLEVPSFKPKSDTDVFQLPPVTDESVRPAATGESVVIRRIAFVGNVAVATETLAAIARPYEGRRLDASEIESLRRQLTRHYIDAGYINSGATLGSKALSDGVLTFNIIEGRLSALRLKGLGRLDEGYVAARLVPDENTALNIEALRERFLLMLTDPLFVRAQARLVPDSVAGRAVLDVDFERARPYQLTAFVNNARVASIGENAFGLGGWVRNLTGWGDYLNASWQTDVEGDGGERHSIGWRLPLGSKGTEFSLQLDSGASTVLENPVAGLDIKSRLKSTDFGLSQRLLNSLERNFTLGINHVRRTNRTSMLGLPFSFTPGEPDGVTRIDGWRFWQEYSHRWEDQALVLRSTFLENHTNLLPAAGAPDRSNRAWLGQGHFARRLNEAGLQASLRTTLQRTGDRLSPLDRIAIGGYQSVRGFRENQLIRDRGTLFNFDLEYPLLRGSGHAPALSLGIFHDIGFGRNQGEPGARMHSSGITMKGQWASWRLDLAVALDRRFPDGIVRQRDALQDKGIHFQVNYAFFD